MKIVSVIPAFNEATTIGDVVKSIRQKVDLVVVVDDGSRDKTAEIAKEASATVISHPVNRGQGASLQTGIDYALSQGADIVVTFDADGQHDPDDIEKLIRPVMQGDSDIVLGSRFLRPDKEMVIPRAKLLTLKLAVAFTKFTTGLSVTDTHNGLRAFTKRVAQMIHIHQNGYAHASEILEQIAKNEFSYKEVPVKIFYTNYAVKKGQSITGAFRILWDLFVGKIYK